MHFVYAAWLILQYDMLWLLVLEDIRGDEDEEEADADWLREEEDEFRQELDKNGDGKLDLEEVYKWVVPDDYDHIEEETKHLITEADKNKVSDGQRHDSLFVVC